MPSQSSRRRFHALAAEGKFEKKRAEKAIAELGLDPEKRDPSIS